MGNNMKPLVTVAVLVYNNVQYIKDCVGSILEQNYPNIQLIISDDSSDDFNKDFVEEFIRKNNRGNVESVFIHTMEKNVGTCRNFNFALSHSKGKYVKFIAADDLFYDTDSLSRLVTAAENDTANVVIARAPNYDMYLERQEWIYPSDKHWAQMKRAANNPKAFFGLMSQYCLISAPSVLFNCDFLNEMGGADERYRLIEDWPLWMRMLRTGKRFTFLDEPVVIYRSGGVSNGEKNAAYAKHQIEYADVIKYECLAYPEAFANKKQFRLAEISERKHRSDGERLLNKNRSHMAWINTFFPNLKMYLRKAWYIFKPCVWEILEKKKLLLLSGIVLLTLWSITDFDILLRLVMSADMASKWGDILYYIGIGIGWIFLACGVMFYLCHSAIKLWNTIKYMS